MSAHVNTVVGISSHILNQHRYRGYFKKSQTQKVIYNAYKKHCPGTHDVQGRKPLRVGYLGQLKPAKGIELLLRTFASLPAKEYKLLIGGKGPEKFVHYLKDRYNLQNIRFLGFVDPDTFFANIDLLIIPSFWHEPLGRTILEAYTHGVPVVASDRGGIPEIVDVGKTGFIFNPDHPDSLITLIVKIKKNPDLLYRMGKFAEKKSLVFLPEYSLSQYVKLYRDTIRSNENRFKPRGL